MSMVSSGPNDADSALEDLEHFRQGARAFIRGNLRPTAKAPVRTLRNVHSDEEGLAAVARDRELQRMLFDAGPPGGPTGRSASPAPTGTCPSTAG